MFRRKSLIHTHQIKFRNLILLFLSIVCGFGSVMVLANLTIQTNIENAWQTIMRVTITDDGTEAGTVIVDINSGGNIYFNTSMMNLQPSFSGNVLGLDTDGNLIYVPASGLVAGVGGTGDGYWTGTANDIRNANTGNVGIGATPATGKLYVTTNAETELVLEESNAGNAANMRMKNTVNTWMLGGFSDRFYIGNDSIAFFNITTGGDVGIGTTTPTAKLTIEGNITSRGFVAKGTGVVASGTYATAMGHNTNASGDQSTAMGFRTDAIGLDSTAMGYGTKAIGEASTTMGVATTGYGYASTAMGKYTQANGEYSVAMGRSSVANGKLSLAMGRLNVVTGENAVVLGGDSNIVTGNNSAIIGGYLNKINGSNYSSILGGRDNIISGASFSFAGGINANALHNYSFIRNSDNLHDFNTTKPQTFIINALSGVGIRTENPQGDLHVAGSGVVILEPQINNPQGATSNGCLTTGSVVFNMSGNKLCYCDGSNRRFIDGSATCDF